MNKKKISRQFFSIIIFTWVQSFKYMYQALVPELVFSYQYHRNRVPVSCTCTCQNWLVIQFNSIKLFKLWSWFNSTQLSYWKHKKAKIKGWDSRAEVPCRNNYWRAEVKWSTELIWSELLLLIGGVDCGGPRSLWGMYRVPVSLGTRDHLLIEQHLKILDKLEFSVKLRGPWYHRWSA